VAVLKTIDEMRPGEIIEARDRSGLAFIPVGPLEWHGLHLPYGTDAIIAEGICKAAAEKVNGVYFKPLNFGLDSYRNSKQLSMWGFKEDDKIFGMDFPGLPLVSEYCDQDEMQKGIIRRLEFIKNCKFRAAFVINHHGGENQIPFIKSICEGFSGKDLIAEPIYSMDYCTIETGLPRFVGTHAGIWETQMMMAFRPDLVDTSKIPYGTIRTDKLGILHNKPLIEEKYDPRNADKNTAERIKENILKNLLKYIENKYKEQEKG
jgi:creatinine amidohydrolase